MSERVTLTLPAGFDPFERTDYEIAETVRHLWMERANDELAEEVERMRENSESFGD